MQQRQIASTLKTTSSFKRIALPISTERHFRGGIQHSSGRSRGRVLECEAVCRALADRGREQLARADR